MEHRITQLQHLSYTPNLFVIFLISLADGKTSEDVEDTKRNLTTRLHPTDYHFFIILILDLEKIAMKCYI